MAVVVATTELFNVAPYRPDLCLHSVKPRQCISQIQAGTCSESLQSLTSPVSGEGPEAIAKEQIQPVMNDIGKIGNQELSY